MSPWYIGKLPFKHILWNCYPMAWYLYEAFGRWYVPLTPLYLTTPQPRYKYSTMQQNDSSYSEVHYVCNYDPST